MVMSLFFILAGPVRLSLTVLLTVLLGLSRLARVFITGQSRSDRSGRVPTVEPGRFACLKIWIQLYCSLQRVHVIVFAFLAIRAILQKLSTVVDVM